MKRYIQIIWFFLFIRGTVAFSIEAILKIGVGQGEMGTRNNIVRIYLENDVPIHTLQFSLADIPDYLKPDSIWVTSRAANFTVSSHDTNGIYTVILFAFDPTASIPPDTGAILNISYSVAPDVNNLKILDLVFYSPPTVYNRQVGLIATTTVNGIFLIGSTGVEKGDAGVPLGYDLLQNYPNPFNPSTCIVFKTPQQDRVTVDIYNLIGQQVCNLVDREYFPGSYELIWNGQDSHGEPVAAGIYLCQMKARSFSKTIRMVLTR